MGTDGTDVGPSLAGEVAIITGAARGQGEGIARAMVARGARVILADIRPDVAVVAASLGAAAIHVCMDVSDPAAWEALVSAGETAFGSVTILVNNAGVFGVDTLVELSVADHERLIAVNQVGPWLGMKTVLPSMRKAGRGAIVNTASLSAHRPVAMAPAYSATKAAVLALTRAAAVEFAPYNIRVNSISPGLVQTPMVLFPQEAQLAFAETLPMRRLGQPQDIAQLICFLVSGQASWITGADIVVDGGQNACQ